MMKKGNKMTKIAIIRMIQKREAETWRLAKMLKGTRSEDSYTGEWLALHNLLMAIGADSITEEEAA